MAAATGRSPAPPALGPPPDSARLVILPSYNSGPLLTRTARAVLDVWQPVWVVLDGSTDASAAEITALARACDGLRVLRLEHNAGKGAAALHAMRKALAAGFSHALLMDADGQHPAGKVHEFMKLSALGYRLLEQGAKVAAYMLPDVEYIPQD